VRLTEKKKVVAEKKKVIAKKKKVVAGIREWASVSQSGVVAEYRGLSVVEMTELRRQARASQVHLRVVTNTLARRAVEGTPFECLQVAFIGPVLIAFAEGALSAPARLMRDFGETNDKLKIKALSLDGQLYGDEHVDWIAKLPTRDEAIATLLGVMQAPISKFVRTLKEVPTKFVRCVAAVRDQKQESV